MAKTPKHHRQPWTPSQDAILRRLAKENTPTPLVAYKTGRTEDAVRNRASEIGLSLKPVNKSPYGTDGKRRPR